MSVSVFGFFNILKDNALQKTFEIDHTTLLDYENEFMRLNRGVLTICGNNDTNIGIGTTTIPAASFNSKLYINGNTTLNGTLYSSNIVLDESATIYTDYAVVDCNIQATNINVLSNVATEFKVLSKSDIYGSTTFYSNNGSTIMTIDDVDSHVTLENDSKLMLGNIDVLNTLLYEDGKNSWDFRLYYNPFLESTFDIPDSTYDGLLQHRNNICAVMEYIHTHPYIERVFKHKNSFTQNALYDIPNNRIFSIETRLSGLNYIIYRKIHFETDKNNYQLSFRHINRIDNQVFNGFDVEKLYSYLFIDSKYIETFSNLELVMTYTLDVAGLHQIEIICYYKT